MTDMMDLLAFRTDKGQRTVGHLGAFNESVITAANN